MLELVTNHCDTPTLYSTYSILEPHTVFRLFRFQFRFRCETILGQVTDDKGKIDRYHTNINSSRLPVNGQACQPLCNNMYSVNYML